MPPAWLLIAYLSYLPLLYNQFHQINVHSKLYLKVKMLTPYHTLTLQMSQYLGLFDPVQQI